MSRRGFLGGAVASGAMVAGGDAFAQEKPINVLERLGKDVDQHVDKFATLLLSQVTQGSPEQSADIKRREALQQELIAGVAYHLKFIARQIEITKGNPIKQDIEEHAKAARVKAALLLEDELKLQEVLKGVRQTPESVHVSNERKWIVGRIAVPISQALPDAAAVRNLTK